MPVTKKPILCRLQSLFLVQTSQTQKSLREEIACAVLRFCGMEVYEMYKSEVCKAVLDKALSNDQINMQKYIGCVHFYEMQLMLIHKSLKRHFLL
jgi:hypothetical protein